MEMLVIYFLLFVVVMVALGVGEATRSKKIENAKNVYLESLEKLKRDPDNLGLKELTLALGRSYAEVAKNTGLFAQVAKHPAFDEVALMNDINVACAGAAKSAVREGREVSADGRIGIDRLAPLELSSYDASKPSVDGRLARLEDLQKKRLISEQEYRARRQQILDEL